MSTGEVLLNFREALRGLVPVMEKAGIPWKRPDAYDEWDSVATALFESLVAAVLSWSQSNKQQEDFRLPEYDVLLESYRGLSTLEVKHAALSESGRWVFHAFGTKDAPFDRVEVRGVSAEGVPAEEGLVNCPVEGAQFFLRLDSGAE